jgi:hypothetical protein
VKGCLVDDVTKRLSSREAMKLLREVQTSIGQDTTTTDLTLSPLNQLTQQATDSTNVSGSAVSVNVIATLSPYLRTLTV